MAVPWPIAGEELKRIRREALDPIVVTSSGLRKVRQLKPLQKGKTTSRVSQEIVGAKLREKISWQPEKSSTSSATVLCFGDAIRLMLPPMEEAAFPTALCACARPGVTNEVGAKEAQPADAVYEESRLARDLAAWGRRAKEFVALTAAAVEEDVVRRSAWTIYRANGLDSFPANSQVHYGQHFMLGQPGESEMSEILLSCEPPSRNGGIGAPYQMLGRLVGFGHASGPKAWNTVFMLAPPKPTLNYGDPVDLSSPVWILPLAPYAYLHGTRILQPMYFGLPNRAGRGCVSRSATVADGAEELLVHAAKSGDDAEWLIQLLSVRGSLLRIWAVFLVYLSFFKILPDRVRGPTWMKTWTLCGSFRMITCLASLFLISICFFVCLGLESGFRHWDCLRRGCLMVVLHGG